MSPKNNEILQDVPQLPPTERAELEHILASFDVSNKMNR